MGHKIQQPVYASARATRPTHARRALGPPKGCAGFACADLGWRCPRPDTPCLASGDIETGLGQEETFELEAG